MLTTPGIVTSVTTVTRTKIDDNIGSSYDWYGYIKRSLWLISIRMDVFYIEIFLKSRLIIW